MRGSRTSVLLKFPLSLVPSEAGLLDLGKGWRRTKENDDKMWRVVSRAGTPAILPLTLNTYIANTCRPFSSCLMPLFQNKAWCTAFHLQGAFRYARPAGQRPWPNQRKMERHCSVKTKLPAGPRRSIYVSTEISITS